MMECKGALAEAKAIRSEAEQESFRKKASRPPPTSGSRDGRGRDCVLWMSGQVAVLVEMNCETDFSSARAAPISSASSTPP
jgi:translation elongation factor EF-Ts